MARIRTHVLVTENLSDMKSVLWENFISFSGPREQPNGESVAGPQLLNSHADALAGFREKLCQMSQPGQV